MRLVAALILVFVTASHADFIRKECQTEESRGMRLASQAMYRAASDAQPFCPISCPSSLYDMEQATQKKFELEAHVSLLKARAMEATKCPQWEQAIMNNTPATDEERAKVSEVFQAKMVKNYAEVHKMREWQKAHPQCKHVEWFGVGSWASSSGQSGTTPGSVEDFSGNFHGQKGVCSAGGDGTAWHGTDDDLTSYDPVTNKFIAQVACADALSGSGFGDGMYADPKSCDASF